MLSTFLVLSACDSPEEQISKLYESGLELLEAGEPQKASLQFRNILEINDSFVPARMGLARIAEQQGDAARMAAELRAVIELDPAHFEARGMLARLLLSAGHPAEALDHAETALKLAPDDRNARLARGGALIALGETTRSLADANVLLALDPTDPDAGLLLVADRIAAGDIPGGLAVTERFMKAHPSYPALNQIKLRLLAANGNLTAMARHLETMSARAPEDLTLLAALADVYNWAGRIAEAEQTFRRVRALEPDNPAHLQTLVRYILVTRGIEDARAELLAEIERAAVPFGTERMLAEFDRQTGHTDAAVSRLEALIASATDSADANTARVQLAQTHLGENRLDATFKLAEDVIAEDARHVTALALRAAVLAEREQPEAAVTDLRLALAEEPDNIGLLQLAARVYRRNGNWNLAGESLAKAVQLSGYRTDTVLAYATLLGQSDQVAAAATLLSTAVAYHPGDLQILTLLARVRLMASDLDGARALLPQIAARDQAMAARLRASIDLEAGQGDRLGILQALAADEGGEGLTAALVSAHVESGQITEANALLDGILAKTPQDPEALQLKGGLALVQENRAEAERYFRAAIAAGPTHIPAQLALLGFLVGDDRREEGMVALDTAIEASPENAVLWLRKAEMELAGGNPEGALTAYETLYQLEPGSLIAANNVASVLSEYWPDDPERLERAYALGKRLSGAANPAFQDTYGWILYLRGDYEGALRSLVPAVEALEGNPWVQYHVGMAYAALDQVGKARTHLEAALALAGDNAFKPREAAETALAQLGLGE
ncbi:MAG: tetratricopeptide repeat protein [Pseudomonadota bacterium]